MPRFAPLPLVLAVGLLLFPQVGTSQTRRVESEETRVDERVVVDVSSDGPRIWRFSVGGYLGVQLLELTPELRAHFGVPGDRGVMISQVIEESPAATSDLRVGDIVTAVDGVTVGSRGDLVSRVVGAREGERLSIEVFRGGAYEVVETEVDRRQRPQLRLDSLHDGEGHYRMSWRTDDDSTVVLPAPGNEHLRVRAESLDEVMETLHERLSSPEFTTRMLEFRSNTEELEERIRELEERLLELSAQLEKLQD